MAHVGNLATRKIYHLMTTPAGLPENLAAVAELEGIMLPEFTMQQVFLQNAAPELVERSVDVRYPTIHIYCEKISNSLREKFRTFSGELHLAIEVRASQDRLEGLDRNLQAYVEAVTRILDQNRGDWGGGMFYAGGYEATFQAVKRGGRNFIQAGKVTFAVAASID